MDSSKRARIGKWHEYDHVPYNRNIQKDYYQLDSSKQVINSVVNNKNLNRTNDIVSPSLDTHKQYSISSADHDNSVIHTKRCRHIVCSYIRQT